MTRAAPLQRSAWLAGVACLLAAVPSPARADPVVRVGAHDGFGRVVWEFPDPTGFTVDRVDDVVTLRFADGGTVPAASGAARNVLAVSGGVGSATVTLAPGARVRTLQIGKRVVLDALDPVRPPPARRAVAQPVVKPPVPKPPMPKPPVLTGATAAPATASAPAAPAGPDTIAVPAAPEPVVVAPAPAGVTLPPPVALANATSDSLAIGATAVKLPAGVAGSAVALPFAPRTGAAAFRRGASAWLVFDEARPIDLSAVTGVAGFAGATVQVLPQATLMRVPVPGGSQVRLQRTPSGWTVIIAADAVAPPPILPAVDADTLLLRAPDPGGVVVVPDPETGQNLLVGTLRNAPAATAVAYRVPGLVLLPSWAGVVMEPLSDRAVLRPVPDGFVAGTGGPLSPSASGTPALADAAFLTRRFDFLSLPPSALLRQVQAQVSEAGAAPAQSRLAPRRAAAQTMIALGMAVEAEALLQLAVTEDPRAAADPDTKGLTAVAALMAGRPAEADGLADPALDGTDEVALWRAVQASLRNEAAPDAAAVFAATAKLVLAYPAALRNRLLPLAAETMALGGAGPQADALLAQLPDEPRLAYARALRLEAGGNTAGALAAYAALVAGRDQLLSARAANRATLLRLSSGELQPQAAADALERGFLDWRGDWRERDARLRVASLRAEAGQWRAALTTAREAASLYPADAAMIEDRMAGLLNQLLSGPAAVQLPANELVALADENAELVARTAPAAVAALMADKLAALDLPRRAAPILDRMMRAAAPGLAQAALGAKLAALRLGDGDATAALAVLSATASPDLPPALAEERGLLSARAAARNGDSAGAAATLVAVGTPAADDLRAMVLTDVKDWRGAAAALASLASRTLPPAGPLTPAQQDVVLRLASAQACAGNEAGLQALVQSYAARLDSPRADMFHLLTAAPVSDVTDLRRSGREIALAHALPAAVAAIGSQ